MNELLRRVLELDENGSKKWRQVGTNIETNNGTILVHGFTANLQLSKDAELIAFYRSAAPRMARALDIAIDALHRFPFPGGITENCACVGCVALKEIEALLTDSEG